MIEAAYRDPTERARVRARRPCGPSQAVEHDETVTGSVVDVVDVTVADLRDLVSTSATGAP